MFVRDAGGEGGGSIEHLSGSEFIEETLLDMTFRVSPEAFFQVNTLGAEIVYKAAIDFASPDADTSVLDVCCGTGTIGLSFSKVSLFFFLSPAYIFVEAKIVINIFLFSIAEKFWAWKLLKMQ